MTYLPHTEDDVQAMLEAVGLASVAELFRDVPEPVRFPQIDLPDGLSQMEVAWLLEDLSSDNVPGGKAAIFLGAGAYNHYIPPVVSHILLRGEFLTAYTPYQPEVSQGTLQAIFEYQSMICQLTGMEASNASHYDGATSLAEAVNLLRANGVNPEVLPRVLENNAARSGVTDLKLPCMLAHEFSPSFSTKNMLKDIRLALELAEPGASTLTASIEQLYTLACQQGLGEEDFAAVVKAKAPMPETKQ